jgi:hypothetical protein
MWRVIDIMEFGILARLARKQLTGSRTHKTTVIVRSRGKSERKRLGFTLTGDQDEMLEYGIS